MQRSDKYSLYIVYRQVGNGVDKVVVGPSDNVRREALCKNAVLDTLQMLGHATSSDAA